MERKYLIGVIGLVAIVGIGGLFLFGPGDSDNESQATTSITTNESTSTTDTSAADTTTTSGKLTSTTGATTTITDGASSTTGSTATNPEDGPVTISYQFDKGDDSWVAGFADLPADFDQADYDLISDWDLLPDGLAGHGLFIAGNNLSADLHMYWTRQLDGLKPNQSYLVEWNLTLATNVGGDMAGIGGSPTESVFVKAGASTIKPVTETDSQGYFRLNIDAGIQSKSGRNATVLGTLNNPSIEDQDSTAYALFEIDGTGKGVMVDTDDEGVLWLFTGVDSGFEGRTMLYYDQLDVTITPVG